MPEPVRDSSESSSKKIKRWPATVVIGAPFVLILIPLYRAAREEMNLWAAIATILVFEVGMFAAEVFSVARGHWVWNDNRILGYRIFGVPIEEPLFYYWVGPLFVITLMHAVRRGLKKRKP